MTVVKDVAAAARPDLKIILMSATLNANSFSKYFNNCPSYHIPGIIYPVQEFYLEDVIEMTGFNNFEHPNSKEHDYETIAEYHEMIGPHLRQLRYDNKYSHQTVEALRNINSEKLNTDLISDLIHRLHVKEDPGAILVFLPGWTDISAVNKKCQYISNMVVYPIHSMMPTVNQRQVFERPPSHIRKVILATQIAGTLKSILKKDIVRIYH